MSDPAPTAVAGATPAPGERLAAAWHGDIAFGLRRSPVAVAAAVVLLACLGAPLFAPWDCAAQSVRPDDARPAGRAGASGMAVRRQERVGDPDTQRQRFSVFGRMVDYHVFPGAALVIMVLAINLLGDWLREALNPSLREVIDLADVRRKPLTA